MSKKFLLCLDSESQEKKNLYKTSYCWKAAFLTSGSDVMFLVGLAKVSDDDDVCVINVFNNRWACCTMETEFILRIYFF